MSQYLSYSSRGQGTFTYASFSVFPASAADGQLAVALDTDTLYAYNQATTSWVAVGGPGTITSIGAFGSSPNAAGGSVSGGVLTLQPADGTHPGGVSTLSQTFAGVKTFLSAPVMSALSASQAVVTDSSKNLASMIYNSTVTNSSLVSRDSNGNSGFNNSAVTVTSTVASGQTITMSAGSSGRQRITGSGNITFNLPDCTTLINGWSFYFNNAGSGTVTVNRQDGSTLVVTLAPGAIVFVACMDNSTVQGAWSASPWLTPGTTSSAAGTAFQGTLSATGALSASNFSGSSSGTNTGDVTLAAVGSSPSANGASLSGQVLTLQPADATHPGLVTTGSQTFAGSKTFSNDVNITTDIMMNNASYGGITVGHTLGHIWSTGLESGGTLSINAGDHTKFDVAAGTGQVIDYSVINAPTIKLVSWNAFTAQTTTGLASADITYVLVDNTGALVQINTYPTADQRRTYIFLGELTHASRTSIAFAITIPDFVQSMGSQVYDFLDALGPFNVSGNILTPNGANLSFNKSAGQIFFRGYNYPTDIENPHVVTIPSAIPTTFAYGLQSGTFVSTGNTTLDVTHYDNAGVLTVIPMAGQATIQRVYLTPNNLVIIQYGQNLFNNLAAATAGIATATFVQNPVLTTNAVLIGYIVVQKNCTALNNTATAALLPAPRFAAGAGGGINTVTSLQAAYNSSVQPQIVVDSTMGGVEIFDNATPIGANIFQVASNGGTNFLSVDATKTTAAALTVTGASTFPSSTTITSGGKIGVKMTPTNDLDVTGTIGATGGLAVVAPAATNRTVLAGSGSTTGWQVVQMVNTSGATVLATEGSAAGTLLTNGTAYATQLYTTQAKNLELGTNGTKAVSIDSSQNTKLSGTLGIGGAPATSQGINVAPTLSSANSWGVAVQPTYAAGVTTAYDLNTSSGVTGALTNYYGLQALGLTGAGTVTSQAGVNVSGFTKGTNNTEILLGTTTIPSGNFGIYQSDSNQNVFGGKVTRKMSSNGTSGSPTTDIGFGLSDTAGSGTYANISFLNSFASNFGTWMTFNTTPTGSSTPLTALTLDASQNATFAGNVLATGNVSSKGDTNFLSATNSAGTAALLLTTTKGFTGSGSVTDAAIAAPGANMKFYTNNSTTVVLGLDSSANATFAGTVTTSGDITVNKTNGSAPQLLFKSSTNGTGGVVNFQNTNGAPTSLNWVIAQNYIGNNRLEFIPSTTNGGSTYSTAAMYFDSSSNATFAGGVATINYDTSSATSGTITCSANKPGLRISGAGGTTLTIKLPSSPIDGQQYWVASQGAFTTVTWQDSGGTAGNVIGGQAAIGGVNRGQRFVYIAGDTKWYAIG